MATKKQRILKEKLRKHVVIPDTNILWHEDKTLTVNPEFDKFWDEHKILLPMELAIPEVVFGELHFQQTSSAHKALAKAKKEIEHISKVSGKRHGTKISENAIQIQVEDKLNKWIRAKSAYVIKTPVNQINWGHLIQQAIWREPPFSSDSKNEKVEKGFLDSLILETVLTTANQAISQNHNVVFLCNDQLLRNTASKILHSKENVIFCESLKSFEGYIKLTQEKLTNKFVAEIQNRAGSRFFEKDDKSCLYSKADIYNQINKQFSAELQPDQISSNKLSGLLALGKTRFDKKASMIWIGSTTFERIEQPRQYFWSTKLTLAFRYEEFLDTTLNIGNQLHNSWILLFEVFVKWSATVKDDARFHNLTLEELSPGERTFKVANAELFDKWGLNNSNA